MIGRIQNEGDLAAFVREQMDLHPLGNLVHALQGALNGRSFDMGTANVAWSGAVQSAAETVTHTLGVAPSGFLPLPIPGGASVAEAQWRVTAWDEDSITFDGTRTAVTTTDTNVCWLAWT